MRKAGIWNKVANDGGCPARCRNDMGWWTSVWEGELARASPRNLYWGGGEDSDTKTHPPLKFTLFSDFGHLIWKMLENVNTIIGVNNKNLYVPRH